MVDTVRAGLGTDIKQDTDVGTKRCAKGTSADVSGATKARTLFDSLEEPTMTVDLKWISRSCGTALTFFWLRSFMQNIIWTGTDPVLPASILPLPLM